MDAIRNSNRDRKIDRYALIGLVLLGFMFWGARSLWDSSEARYGQVAFGMLTRGNWLVPTLTGLLCGACRIPLRAYLSGSLIGFIPLTVVFAVFGRGGARGNLYLVGLGYILIAITVFGRKTVMRAFPSREPSIQRR